MYFKKFMFKFILFTSLVWSVCIETSLMVLLDTNSSVWDNSSYLHLYDIHLEKYANNWSLIEPKPQSHLYPCICDQTPQCDIECCCDQDCGQIKKYAFSKCLPIGQNQGKTFLNLCYAKTRLLDKTQLEQAKESRLMCIARVNADRKQSFANRNIIIKHGQLTTIKAKHHFYWSGNNYYYQNPTEHHYQTDEHVSGSKSIAEYKSGYRIIWAKLNNNVTNGALLSIDYWKLPFALNFESQNCNYLKHVNYLYNFYSICRRNLSDLERTCINDKYLDVDMYFKSRAFFNRAVAGGDDQQYILASVRPDRQYRNVHFNVQSGICSNVVHHIEYTVRHDGIFGISDVSLKVRQVNVSSSARYIQQHFVVNFKWLKQNDSNISSNKTINYTFGAKLQFYSLKENDTFDMVERRLIASFQHGQCNLAHKLHDNHFHFGINQMSTCHLNARITASKNQTCDIARHKLAKFVDQNISNIFVGVYGNYSHRMQLSDQRLELIDLEKSVSVRSEIDCSEVITGLAYQFYFVKEGLANQPRLKIVGATYKTIVSSLKPNCTENTCDLLLNLDLVSSVNFIDVTEPIRPDFAPPPSVNLELPGDFFYPFSTNSPSKRINMPNIYSLCMICINVLLLQLSR